jgi:hypothetical protein
MLSGPDLADLIAYARACGAKVILAGDVSQLQAVQSGGGMALLAGALGYVRLAEPVRFRHEWEQEASLRLRDGDATVLAEYDQHGRILGGEPEEMMDAAAAAYVALAAAGTDTLLMAADHALRRELSRRIRDELIGLGIVAAGPAVRIADGTQASVGDLIICTRNDHTVEAGEPGRALANGDLLRIEAITKRGLTVRRAVGADPRTGQRRWTDRTFLYQDYGDAELGYAVTDHVAQGRTVHTGLAVITGTEDRQHAYVALSRSTDANLAYVFTVSPKLADPAPGPRPAPELARYDRRATGSGGQSAVSGEALAVLAGVLDRDGQQRSATQIRHQALAADHLALLHAIWAAETTPARQRRYQELLMSILPPGYHREPSHQAKWLWRTLRAAELAGLDPAQALADAIGERDLAGSRDLAAVLDARLRYRLGSPVPLPAGPWSAQVPQIGDPERRAAYLTQIAALMDARKDRLGEHAAEHVPPWTVAALGPVPAHPLDRLDWQRRAAAIGAWRELSGYHHPADPIGPEPVAAAPDLRAAGTRPSPPSAPPTDPMSAACPTGCCCTCATPTRSKPPGHPDGSAMSSARSAPPPGTPAWPACAPARRPTPLSNAATTPKPPASANWPAATRRSTTPTGSARTYSPPPWPTGPTGTRPPCSSGTWPWPPTPNYAAATPPSTTRRSAPPNPSPPPTLSAATSPLPRGSGRRRCPRGSRTWPPRTGRSPPYSPTGRP